MVGPIPDPDSAVLVVTPTIAGAVAGDPTGRRPSGLDRYPSGIDRDRGRKGSVGVIPVAELPGRVLAPAVDVPVGGMDATGVAIPKGQRKPGTHAGQRDRHGVHVAVGRANSQFAFGVQTPAVARSIGGERAGV